MYLPFSHAQTPQCPNVPKLHEEAVRAKVRVVNNSQELKLIGRHEHLSQILPTEETSSFTSTPSLPSLPQPVKPKSSLPFSSSVFIDELEALSIAASIKHFSPFIIQSLHPTTVLTDSKTCVQEIDKLCRGKFSASPRVTSFLTTVSRYQVNLQHPPGKANLPSDFTSLNAPDCSEPNCQICNFVHEMEDSVVRNVSIHDILNSKSNLPFTTRSAWQQIQHDCPVLRRVHAHLNQGTRASKKLRTKTRTQSPRRLSVNIRQEPDGRPVSAVGLALATARINSLLRLPGLSSRELWSQRNQFTHEHLPLLITTSYLVDTSNVPLTMPPVRSLRTPAVLFQTRLLYTLATLCTSFPIRTSVARVIAMLRFPLTFFGASLSECYATPPSVIVRDHPGL